MIESLWGFHVAVERIKPMMCWILTTLVTLPGASSFNSGQCQSGTLWRHWCDNTWMSINMLRSLLNRVENPRRTGEKRRMKCVIAGKKAHCVNDKPWRGRRTLHCHADIHSLVGSLLPEIWQTLWCFHREQLTHTHTHTHQALKLLSSHFNLPLSACNP